VGTWMPRNTFRGIQLGGNEPDRGQYDYVKVVQGVVAACMYVRGDLFSQIGGFDERYFAYFEDTDLCFMAQEAGWLTVYDGFVRVVHDQNTTINNNVAPEQINFETLYGRSRVTFMNKWERKLLAGVVT